MRIIDIHSHLVPGVDDGARDPEMSKALLRQAVEEGIGAMIVTPHNYPGHTEEKTSRIQERFALLRRLAEETAPELELYLGNEVFYRDEIVRDLREGRALTMAGSSYVLTEFHPSAEFRMLSAGVRRLLDAGYYPIIAHAERVGCLGRQERRLEELWETGACIQVNAHVLSGGRWDRVASFWRRQAAQGLVHFWGSDAHDPVHRPVRARTAFEKLTRTGGSEIFKIIAARNPQRLLQNERIR